jgi:hypothetical protein
MRNAGTSRSYWKKKEDACNCRFPQCSTLPYILPPFLEHLTCPKTSLFPVIFYSPPFALFFYIIYVALSIASRDTKKLMQPRGLWSAVPALLIPIS